ncbi:MAG: hypothetical protein ACP5UA_10730, partial [Candidatus Hydrogenedens sp.]
MEPFLPLTLTCIFTHTQCNNRNCTNRRKHFLKHNLSPSNESELSDNSDFTPPVLLFSYYPLKNAP